MGRHKSYREPRRRGFDDDNYSPRDHHPTPSHFSQRPLSPSSPIEATVAWFNPDKGFGFVKTSEGADAFLHIRALETAGHDSVPAGARLQVRVGQGQKGLQVTEVLQVDLSTAQPSSGTASRTRTSEQGETSELEGSVKWYSPEKAFGFIGVNGGGKDVFVHRSAIVRSGLDTLSEGQPVVVKFVAGQRGPEAVSIRLVT
jgi:CspA family cold shock protein